MNEQLAAAVPLPRRSMAMMRTSWAQPPTFEVEQYQAAEGAGQRAAVDQDLVRLPVNGLLNFSVPIFVAGAASTSWCLHGHDEEELLDGGAADGPSNYAVATRLGHYACMAVTLLGLTSVNYFVASLIADLPNMSGVFWETMLGWAVANSFVLMAQHKTWEAINCEDTGHSVVTRLLYSNVLADTAGTVRKWKMDTVEKQQFKLALFVGFFFAFIVVIVLFTLGVRHPGWTLPRLDIARLDIAQLAALGIAVVTMPIYVAATGMPWMLSGVLFTVLGDRVLQITRRVRSSTAASLNFREVIENIHLVDADITKLASYAKWLCLQTVIGNACAGMPWAIVGLGPQPPADHWWSEFNISYICCANCICFVLFGISTISTAAKITSCCDELRDAINRLRVSSDGNDHRNVAAANPEQVLNINNLLDYMDGMNDGAGMGFCLYVKVSYSLVANAAVSAASLLGVMFTTLLHFVEETGAGSY